MFQQKSNQSNPKSRIADFHHIGRQEVGTNLVETTAEKDLQTTYSTSQKPKPTNDINVIGAHFGSEKIKMSHEQTSQENNPSIVTAHLSTKNAHLRSLLNGLNKTIQNRNMAQSNKTSKVASMDIKETSFDFGKNKHLFVNNIDKLKVCVNIIFNF